MLSISDPKLSSVSGVPSFSNALPVYSAVQFPGLVGIFSRILARPGSASKPFAGKTKSGKPRGKPIRDEVLPHGSLEGIVDSLSSHCVNDVFFMEASKCDPANIIVVPHLANFHWQFLNPIDNSI